MGFNIKKALKIHRLQYSQLLPISLDEALTFFSTPKNLNEIMGKLFIHQKVNCIFRMCEKKLMDIFSIVKTE